MLLIQYLIISYSSSKLNAYTLLFSSSYDGHEDEVSSDGHHASIKANGVDVAVKNVPRQIPTWLSLACWNYIWKGEKKLIFNILEHLNLSLFTEFG